MSSYDVKALFTLVPVDSALDIIHGRLQQDLQLTSRTFLSIHNIVTLLEFCIKSTFFTFQDKYYEHIHGVTMGSPISPLVANLFMGNFEARAIGTDPNPSGSGLGTWITPLLSTRQNTHSNSLSTSIHLTPKYSLQQRPLTN